MKLEKQFHRKYFTYIIQKLLNIYSSKIQHVWRFILDGIDHRIDFWDSKLSGKKKNKKNLSAKEIFNSRINYFYKMSHNIDNDINKKRKKIKITKNKKEIKKNGSSILLNNSKGISLSMNCNSFEKGNKNIMKKTFG